MLFTSNPNKRSRFYRKDTPPGSYEQLLQLLEAAIETLAAYGPPKHAREKIPEPKSGNKTLYGCLPGCFEPNWLAYGSFEYNACEEDFQGECVEPLYGRDVHRAQFWTVYGRKTIDCGFELVAITDVTTEKMAQRLCERFSGNITEESYAVEGTPVPGSVRDLLSGHEYLDGDD